MKRRFMKIFANLKDEAHVTYSIASKLLGISYRQRKSAVILYLFGAALEIFASLLTIYATAKLFSLLAAYVVEGGSTSDLWYWLAVDVLATLLIGLGFWTMQYAGRLVYFSMNQWCVQAFTQTLCRLDIQSYYDNETRTEINRAYEGFSWQIPNLTITYLELIYSVFRFAAIAVVVAQIQWWLILVIAIFLLPSFLSKAGIAKIEWLIWGEKGDNRHVFNGLMNIFTKPRSQMELRSMQAAGSLTSKIHSINRVFYQSQEKKFKQASKMDFGARFFEVFGVGIGSVVLLRQVLYGTLSLDRFFFLSGALLRVNGALNAIFGTLSRLQEPQRFSQNFFSLLDLQPQIVDKPGAIKLSQQMPEVVFDKVSFKYPGKVDYVFKDLSLTIKPGEHVALVGENGAGKTTLIKLLLRFYQPTDGKILIDGVDLNDISIDSWYEQLATLMQSFNEYPFSVRENIAMGRSDKRIDAESVEKAAKFGNVDKFVAKYKHGWDTVLDASFKKGVEPSGGQWQRVALSRAFYRNANVLILDEPTAAIDSKAEYDIFNNIFKHYQDKTTIIVSHRFSTVRRADRIVVLDKGNIIEEGSHRDLMKKHGLYHELFTKQAEGYKD